MVESTDTATTVEKWMTDVEMTSSNHTTMAEEQVQLYAVIPCFTSLLILVTLGGAMNILVIIGMLWRRRCIEIMRGGSRVVLPLFREDDDVTRTRRVLVPSLCIGSLVICFIAAPFEFTAAYERYVGRAVPTMTCVFANSTLHMSLGVITCCLAMMSVTEGSDVSSEEMSVKQSEKNKSGRQTSTKNNSKIKKILYLVLPWLFGAAAAIVVALCHSSTIDYKICIRHEIYSEDIALRSSYWPGPNVGLVVIYILVMTISLTFLARSIYRMTLKISVSILHCATRDSARKSDQASLVLGEGRVGDLDPERGSGSRCGSDRSKRKNRRTSSTSVQSDFKLEPSREASRDASSQDSLNSAVSSRRTPSQQMMRSGSPLPRSDADCADDDDDDTFDNKKRLRFQKKTRSNSRRHTVANIGIPDLASLRNGFECGGRTNRKTPLAALGNKRQPNNYNYVRKWSVDITALANQLENPKAHTSSYPILRERSVTENLLSPEFNSSYKPSHRGGHRRAMSPIARPPREVINKPPPIPLDVTTLEQTPDNSGGSIVKINEEVPSGQGSIFHYPHPPSSTSLVRTLSRKRSDRSPSPPAVVSPDAFTREVENPILQLDEVESVENTCFFEPPSIVVSVTTDDEDNEARDSSNAGGDLHGDNDRRHTGASGSKSYNLDECGKKNDEVVARVNAQLKRARRTAFLLLVAILLTLPYSIIIIIQYAKTVLAQENELLNARLVTCAVAMLQAFVFPVVIVFVDDVLCAEVRRWWVWLRKLKCVCYCNIGAGKNCCEGRRVRKPRDIVTDQRNSNNLQAVDPPAA